MKNKLLWILVVTLVVGYFFVSITQNLKTKRNTLAISLTDSSGSHSLSVAVIGDVHLPEGPEPLEAFHSLLREIKSTQPDLVVFVGDYTSSPRGVGDMQSHRENIINSLRLIDPLPSLSSNLASHFAVFGAFIASHLKAASLKSPSRFQGQVFIHLPHMAPEVWVMR